MHLATVGNPGMHMPTMLSVLTGVEAFATKMMKKEMEKLDMPPMGKFLETLYDTGCKLWVCKLALDMFHLKEEDPIDDLDGILSIGDFYNRADQEGTQLLFI